MKPLRWTGGLLALAILAPALAGEQKEDGFVPLFNGKDLKGWVNVNCAPGTFFVKDGEIVTTGKPTGYLRTERQYENFVLELEWMHVNRTEVGNSGVFIWGDPLPAVGTPFTRGIEVQVLVNLEKEGYYTSHGDVFSIQGATCTPDRPHPHGWARCLPSERRAKGGGEWNHYRIVAKDGALKLHVNGKEVSGVSACRPRKGYLALESEGAECHFRNIQIQELPSSNPKPEEVAAEAKDFTNLFTGLDLSGWETSAAARKHWQPRDWVLHYDGQAETKAAPLWTARTYQDFELSVDYRLPAKRQKDATGACRVLLRGDPMGQAVVAMTATGTVEVAGQRKDVKGVKPAGQWNRLHATLKGDRLTVRLNGQPVVEGTEVKNVPSAGAVGLQSGGGAVDFANVFIRGLK